jgi:uncharacterized protein (TIGR02270 family)
MPSSKTAIVKHIVDQYFDEAAFLWSQRDAAATSSYYSLKDLAYVDSRVEAHLDGLRIAGDHGWGLCEGGIDPADPGTVFTAAVIAFESGKKSRIKLVVETASESHAAFRAAISGLGWIETQQFNSGITELVSHKSRRLRRLGMAACGIRRVNPRVYLEQAIQSEDLILKAIALDAAGELKRLDLLPELQKHSQHQDPACRFAAATSALLLGERSLLDGLGVFALSTSKFKLKALQFALRVVDGQTAHNWFQTLAKDPEQRRTMLKAIGFRGDPVYLPMLLKQMETPEYARLAGETFSCITGVDLVSSRLSAGKPESFQAGPTDDPDDADVGMDKDEDLPWPDVERLTHWWQQNEGTFPAGARYLAGHPISLESCAEILRSGNQQQRYAASLEIALASPEEPFVNTKAPGFRQVTEL